MSIRALIVDDEPIARTVLREEVDLIEGIEIVGEADSGLSALELIEAERPDVVFLDLQMPGMNGFEVVRRMEGGVKLPIFIVVTAFDQFAIEAFAAGAIDYLLKPVRQERLCAAMDRVARLLRQSDGPARQLAALQTVAEGPKAVKRIVAKSGPEYLLLSTKEVFAFQAEGDLVYVITAQKRYLATETLREIQAKLQGTGFKRIHRKALVNVDHIRKMSPLSSQRWLVTLSNSLEYTVSKRQAKSVRDLLSW